LIGYGLAGATFHAPLIAAVPELELTAIVTHDPARREKAAQDFSGARLFDRVEMLWANASAFDLVIVASPNATHEPIALAALESDINVVIDKPFATTAAGARTLVDLARQRHLFIAPFQNRRWDGDMLTVRRLLAADALGRVFRFESRMERWRAAAKPRWTSPDARRSAEGLIYDLGSHLVDQAIVLFGAVAQVYAESDRVHPDVQVEDDAFIALTHTSGVRSRLVMSTTGALSGPRMSVYGSRGTFLKYGLDPQEDQLKNGVRPGDAEWGSEPREQWGRLHDGTSAVVIPTEPGSYEAFYSGVARSLRTGAPAPIDPLETVHALAVLEAAHQSAASGRPVSMADSTFGPAG
jgi:predicted dehydrogenase